MEYTVHFQKGSRVGTRSLRMETVNAATVQDAEAKAKAAFPDYRALGYRITRVDHFDGLSLVSSWRKQYLSSTGRS